MSKEWWIALAVVAVLLLAFEPVIRASQRYRTATHEDDRCAAALELAAEWGGVGMTDMRDQWRRTAALDCLIAEGR